MDGIAFADYQSSVNQTLEHSLPPIHKAPYELHKAMRYVVFNGGKRIRSVLTYLIGETFGADKNALDKICAAIELIHAFSLVHDDLPAIDNDDLRRGKPACHIAFSEATAILTGDALLALAFELLASIDRKQLSAEANLEIIHLLSHYIGSRGMAGGEMLDIALKDHAITLNKLSYIYKLKTSYLICASILAGALSADCHDKIVLNDLEQFGLYIGLAFQIHDDIIGLESDTQTLGKPQGSDTINHKPTYPALIGLANAKIKEKECYEKAMQYLQKTHLQMDKLVALSDYVICRAA